MRETDVFIRPQFPRTQLQSTDRRSDALTKFRSDEVSAPDSEHQHNYTCLALGPYKYQVLGPSAYLTKITLNESEYHMRAIKGTFNTVQIGSREGHY
jgi:hypothetical protein